jgi:phage-related minor tail protein
MAMDAVESENLFEVAMGAVAGDARKWSEETSKALGLNAYNVRNNMATYNAMLTSMGLTSDESLKMSEGLTQLSYDMASFYNLKPEEAFDKLKSGISGEAEPLKALGILVNDNTIKTYAYANGIAKQGEQLTEAQKVQARYGAIMEATKNAQGDLARTMDSPTNKLRIMKEQAQQIGIQFGQILIPILEKLIAIIKPLMDQFQGLSKEQQEMIVKIALVAAAVGPVLLIVGKVVSVIGTITTAFGAVSGAIAAAGGASGAVGAAIAAITGPVGIAIAAVAGFIAIFVLLFKNNETFRNSVITVWNQIKTIMAGVFEAIKALIQAFVQVAGAIWQKYGADIVTVISAVFNVIASVVTTALNVIKNIIQIVTSLIKGDWQGVWEGVKNLTQNLWNGIQSVISGVLNLIKGIISVETGFVKNTISGAWNTVKSVTSSIWQGIKTAIETPINAAKNTVKNAIDAIVGFFRNIKLPEIKIPQIKLPHFELTGKFSLSPPQVPKLSVNWYSTGGIFSSPSVIGVGEAGTEAVIPVEKLDELMARALQKVGVGAKTNASEPGIQTGSVTNNYDITINNPKPEAASDSTRRALLRQSYGLG